MASISLRVGYRPLRIGWCLRSNNREQFRTAVKLACTLWGGVYGPIIDVDDPNAGHLIQTFGVDLLYPLDKSDEVIKEFRTRFNYLDRPDLETFSNSSKSSPLAFVLDVRYALEQILEDRRNEMVPFLQRTYSLSREQSSPWNDVLLAMFGGYSSTEEVGVNYEKLLTDRLQGATISDEIVLGPEVAESFTPFAVSQYALQPLKQDYIIGGSHGIFLGSADDFQDLLCFWNLRASGCKLLFYDSQQNERVQWIFNNHLQACRRWASENSDYIGIWGRTWDKENPWHKEQNCAIRHIDERFWRQLPKLSYFGWEAKDVLGSIDLVSVPPIYTFMSPPKPLHGSLDPLQQIGMTIELSGDLTNSDFTFWIPDVPELNPFFGERTSQFWFDVRSGRDFYTRFSSLLTSAVKVSAIRKFDLLTEFGRAFGIQAELSQPGIIARRLINQMGGLAGCTVFQFPGVRNLIDHYAPLKSFTRGAAVSMIYDKDEVTKISSFEQQTMLRQTIRALGNADKVFNFMLQQGIFRAGLELQCPNCNLFFWLSLDNIGNSVSCDLCGHQFVCTPQLKDRDWRFRRSGLFGREDHQEGSIPVVLTLKQIASVLSFSFGPLLYETAATLKGVSSSINPCETDFLMLTEAIRGPLQLVIGECKSSGSEISDADVDNLCAVAGMFPTNRIEVFVVFSKTGQFTTEEIERFKRADSRFPSHIITLSARELNGHFTYESAARDFQVSATAISLNDMARNTGDIFLHPRVKP